ncbi:hypothetical protein KDJ56_14135 [Brevibacillus composti]|uniref:Uncharacterized protein n=1 Tax=Brevibacillus composti TaxID=2796470 RepID=A0A7T5JMJ4_9BACL|nr:hypothetical protein [Brevibacillus composti]QQE73066.1 hypothetical protein JD108_14190 [Brevibacillus composti]QUO40144.1 hypothetical protein KDJ56_14135 [Brevibacillus composti]
MNKKMWVLMGILLAAACFGFEGFAIVMNIETNNIGYVLGALSFLGAVIVGARN